MRAFFAKNPIYVLVGAVFFAGVSITATFIYLIPSLHYAVFIEPTIHDVASTEFYERYRANPEKYDFIDVRPADMYAQGHATGSRNIPLNVLYTEHKFLPKKGKEIVLICSGGSASGVAYGYLEHFGFNNLSRIEGGISYWKAAGLPVQKGK